MIRKILFWLNTGAGVINVVLSLVFGMPVLFFTGGLSLLVAYFLLRRA